MLWRWVGGWGTVVLVLVACSVAPVAEHRTANPEPFKQAAQTLPETQPSPKSSSTDEVWADVTPPTTHVPASGVTQTPTSGVYEASSMDYRRHAAQHIYKRLPERIYKGKLPPHLKAVAVVDVLIDPTGQVAQIHWVRLPKYAPEVKQEIEQAIYQSAPFPAPSPLQRVSYTDTWLWHKSGRFQLDTLTEGQH